jgi:hypothetical protein
MLSTGSGPVHGAHAQPCARVNSWYGLDKGQGAHSMVVCPPTPPSGDPQLWHVLKHLEPDMCILFNGASSLLYNRFAE